MAAIKAIVRLMYTRTSRFYFSSSWGQYRSIWPKTSKKSLSLWVRPPSRSFLIGRPRPSSTLSFRFSSQVTRPKNVPPDTSLCIHESGKVCTLLVTALMLTTPTVIPAPITTSINTRVATVPRPRPAAKMCRRGQPCIWTFSRRKSLRLINW